LERLGPARASGGPRGDLGSDPGGISERTDFELDYRTVHPDGTIKYVHALGHPVFNAAGDVVEFVGTSIDMTERRRAEEARLDAQNNLAHANRVTAMGQLAASIAHEVNQPIAATVTNAGAALRWLDRRPPNLDEARQALVRIAKDGNRAAEVIDEIRALIKKAPPRKDRLEISWASLWPVPSHTSALP
jgi:signal transduction histidine kinase